jgi:hypothetical protein
MDKKCCANCVSYSLTRWGGDYWEPPTYEWGCEYEEETNGLIELHGLGAASHCALYEVKTCVQ